MAKVYISDKYCKGCNLCVHFCPKDVLETSTNLSKQGVPMPAVVHIDKCSGCGVCELFCPDFAIVVEKEAKEGAAKK
ncbi:4Fe-4S dicluster domain-containing protein [Chloroflexota bacterium]